jgi:adenine-specific DNA-methyltransferase
LETLPNIDINIKCGNSLVSRFAIDADLKQALKKSKWTIDSYRIAVDTYRNAENKEQKREMDSKVKELSKYFSKAGYETYSKGADIYCLFYELGGRILKTNGILTYITSNSWLRAIYGDLLRNYFKNNLQPVSLLNIEDIQVFEEATVESNIMTLKKANQAKSFQTVNLNADYEIGGSLDDYFKANQFEFIIPDTSEWFIGDQVEGKLKLKIEADTEFLKDFDVTINFGIKTGLNEAFIIDEDQRNELINADPVNAEIIKPILRGRDLKKYSYEFQGVYLINTHNGVKSIDLQRVDVEHDYPLVFNHLKNYTPKVIERSDKGDHWTNLRNCAYLQDFEKPKIIWGEISDKPKFAYDDNNYYAEATTFLMTGEKLKYLLAILNSKVSAWYFNLIGTTTGMGTNRWKKYKIELLPVKLASPGQEREIIELVDEVIGLKENSPHADTTALENQIDRLVYQLYNLTEEEIQIIEKASK